VELDRQGRVPVRADLSLEAHPEVFVAGDLARCEGADGKPLPALASVAQQQGEFLGDALRRELRGRPRGTFRYRDRGQMATIGRSRAILQTRRWRFGGRVAWWAWLFVHIYQLTGFRNRLIVFLQWSWSYLTFRRGVRVITERDWRRARPDSEPPGDSG
jgi:NADH dehydrogenase